MSAQSISITESNQLTLSSLLSKQLNEHLSIPLACSIDEQNFTLIKQPFSSENIELVVFNTLTLAQLISLTKTCQLTLIGINNIVTRNKQTSIRFAVTCDSIKQSRELLSTFALSEQIDAAITHHAPTLEQPGLLVMDMDSTTIKIECIDEIAALAGVGEQVAEVTELAMQGKLDFSESLYQRVATLKEAPESILADVVNNIPLMEGLTTLVNILQAHHWKVAIASGGFTYFADHLKEMLSLDAAVANQLEIVDNKLTGNVLGEVVDANVKAKVLKELQEQYHITPTQTVAMGDGANDLVMMAAAHLGVAYKAKPLVLAKADTSINYSGLDCMLHWLK